MAELLHRAELDLSHPLAGHVQSRADLFQSPRSAIVESKPETDHVALATGQPAKDAVDLLSSDEVPRHVARSGHRGRRDEVSDRGVVLLADRSLEREWFDGYAEHFLHSV